jgi:hypothetical protein
MTTTAAAIKATNRPYSTAVGGRAPPPPPPPNPPPPPPPPPARPPPPGGPHRSQPHVETCHLITEGR